MVVYFRCQCSFCPPVSPPVPTISWTPSTGYVSEDAELSCTCSGSVGHPQGRLRWFRHSANNVDTPVKDGNYGDVTLQVMMTVNKTHNGDALRCDVDWVTDTTGPSHTIVVACECSPYYIIHVHTAVFSHTVTIACECSPYCLIDIQTAVFCHTVTVACEYSQ